MSGTIKHSGRIRLGLIGCGPVTQNAYAGSIANAANIHLHAIADHDRRLLNGMKDRLRPERVYRHGDDLLSDPQVDLVLIAIADHSQFHLVQKALASGKHVLIEIPARASVEECEQLRSLLPRGKVLAVGSNWRFLPGVRATRQFLREDGGNVMSYASYYYDNNYRHEVSQAGKTKAVKSRGITGRTTLETTHEQFYDWLTHGPHLLDVARHLLGSISAIRVTYRELSLGRGAVSGPADSPGGRAWRVDFRFGGDLRGQTSILLHRTGGFESGFELECAGGHVTCSYPYTRFQRGHTRIYSAARQLYWSPDASDSDTYRIQLESLAQSILHGAPLVNGGLEDGIACVKALVAGAYSSLNGGQWVDIEDAAGDWSSPLLCKRELAVA
jgi:predicted dehydrogenase